MNERPNVQQPLHQYKKIGIQLENIPQILKDKDQWVVWKAEPRGNGKVDKKPVGLTGYPVNGMDSKNQLSFTEAYKRYENGEVAGIGFVLDGKPFTTDNDGEPLYLTAVDLDNCVENGGLPKAKALRQRLSIYSELSPSLKGVRMFGLTRTLIKGGNAGEGRELYGDKRFLTVTGIKGQGDIVESAELSMLEGEWFKKNPVLDNLLNFPKFPDSVFESDRNLRGDDLAETDKHIARVTDALNQIPANIPYDSWRDIIWAVCSLHWDCAEKVLTEWSQKSDEHWDSEGSSGVAQENLRALMDSFKPAGGISIGTLFHHAKAHGWTPQEGQEDPWTDKSAVQTELGNGLTILNRAQLDGLPPMDWLVAGVLPSTGLASIYGQPGSGKTFLALDLAAHISEGVGTWFGLPCKQRDVLYIALEGGGGIKKRVLAWEAHNKRAAPSLKFALGNFNLKSHADVDGLLCSIEGLSPSEGMVIVLDTLNQASPGSDENSSVDMGLLLQAMNRMHQELKGLVIAVHHSGKDSSKGLRGHSSLNAAMDLVIEVKKDQLARTWRIQKSKDGDDNVQMWFDLALHNVETGGLFGDTDTSCAVKEIIGHQTKSNRQPRRGKNQIPIYAAIDKVISSGAALNLDEANNLATITLQGLVSTGREKETAKEVLNKLIDDHYLLLTDGMVTLPP